MLGENIVLNKKSESISSNKAPLVVGRFEQPVHTPQLHGALLNGFNTLVEGLRMTFYELVRPYMWQDAYLAGWQAPQFGGITSGWTYYALGFGGVRYPYVDVVDEGDFYVVRAELPGFDREEVSLLAGGNTLQIRAERKSASDGVNYLHREIVPAVFQRTITFPEEIVPSKIEATMKNGILEAKILKSGTRIEENLVKVNVR
jgi:HSP20 family protein